jgi:hypothetical protein
MLTNNNKEQLKIIIIKLKINKLFKCKFKNKDLKKKKEDHWNPVKLIRN